MKTPLVFELPRLILALSFLVATAPSSPAQSTKTPPTQDPHLVLQQTLDSVNQKSISPEDRIQRIDQARVDLEQAFKALRNTSSLQSQNLSKKPAPDPETIYVEVADPLQARILEEQANLVAELNRIESAPFSSEGRIAAIDGLQARHPAWQSKAREQKSSRQAPLETFASPETTTRRPVDQANTLSPEQRIAEIDRESLELNAQKQSQPNK